MAQFSVPRRVNELNEATLNESKLLMHSFIQGKIIQRKTIQSVLQKP